jgi:pimeloyl-ACP methyl ester carboxylesterase
VRHLTSGEGPPLVLVHTLGESAIDLSWVLPALSRDHRVYAPVLPGIGGDGESATDHSPAFFASFIAAFLDALDIERAWIVGNSLGGLIALRLALSDPARVSALGLVGSAGLGRRAISSALSLLTMPGYGEAAIALCKTPVGARQRAWGRTALLFARPWSAPRAWLAEQYRLALTPGFLEATLAALRAQVGPRGQREELPEELSLASRSRPSWWGAPAIGCSPSPRQGQLSPGLRKVLSPSSRTAAACPTSSNRSASLRSSAGSWTGGEVEGDQRSRREREVSWVRRRREEIR